MPTPDAEIERLKVENDRLREERRAHNQDWQDQVMGEFRDVKARISGLNSAITGGDRPENGMQYRVLLLEREVELQRAEKLAAAKKFDQSLLVWPPILLLILDKIWSFFSSKH